MFLFVFIPLGWGGKNDVMKKPAMKKPAAAGSSDPTGHEHVDTLNDTDKYNQAMALTGGDTTLSTAVCNISRTQNNAWKDYLQGPVTQELKDEWHAIAASGFGNQKKLSLLFELLLYIFVLFRLKNIFRKLQLLKMFLIFTFLKP